MSHNNGLGRRAFLRNAGMTALVGAVGSGSSVAAAAATAALAGNGKFDFDTRTGFGTGYTTSGFGSAAGRQVGMGIADMDFAPRRRSPRRWERLHTRTGATSTWAVRP